MSIRAVWNGQVLAEADQTVVVEGNRYFPPESLNREYLAESSMKTVCFWKGVASYYSVTVDGLTNQDAAWYYPKPSPLARKIRNHVAFRHDVQIIETSRRGSN